MPANVYGYAAIVGYSLHEKGVAAATPDMMGTGPLDNLTSPSLNNPLVKLIISMVLGAIAGYLSGLAAGAIGKKATA